MAAEGKGEMGPSANDIKKSIGATLSGLDQTGRLYPDRIDGLEHWIEQGVVVLHWMQFERMLRRLGDVRKAKLTFALLQTPLPNPSMNRC